MVQKTSSIILDVASKLFSKKGFNGTSIREIASKAKVNISAISYHFESKENLFLQVFLQSHSKFDLIFNSISEDLSVAEFSFELYKKLQVKQVEVLNSFRMLLEREITIPKKLQKQLPPLPPGGNALFRIITKEIGEEISESKRYWVACLIFQNIFFSALFENLKMIKSTLENYQNLIQMSKKEEIYSFINLILRNSTDKKNSDMHEIAKI